MQTRTIKLTSGVPCEITKLGGKQQRIITENKKVPFEEKSFELVASLIVSIGTVNFQHLSLPEQQDMVRELLLSDRKQILVESRIFTYGDDLFVFGYKYVDRNNKQQTIEKEIEITEFPTRPLKVYDEALIKSVKTLRDLRGLRNKLRDADFTEYSEVVANKLIEGTLPETDKTIRLTLRDGNSEVIAGNTKRDEQSSHTAILMAKPVWIDGNTPITFKSNDLDKLDGMDIEYMRGILKAMEGGIDTELQFEHPEAQYLSPDEQFVVIDITAQPAFFFPSEMG